MVPRFARIRSSISDALYPTYQPKRQQVGDFSIFREPMDTILRLMAKVNHGIGKSEYRSNSER